MSLHYPSKALFQSHVNEIISLGNLADCKLGWLLALYHVSLLLPGIGTYFGVYMALTDWRSTGAG